MTYDEVLSAIHSKKRFSEPTLDRIRRLMGALGNPQEQYKIVHVAGTNGKGSVCAMIHGALKACGYKTGLFTSPYLKDFRERIRINGEDISKELLISCYEMVAAAQAKLEEAGYAPINEFELVTAIGFLAFAHSEVDYVVLEVGLGGKSDPTNLVKKPAVSVIMPISLDHTAVLGNTIPEIAGEKAGIVKNGCPVVLAKQPEDARQVFYAQALQCGSTIYESSPISVLSVDKHGSRFCVEGREVFLPLLGKHQTENAAVALKTCQVLGLDMECVIDALKSVSWPGRLQFFPEKTEFLVDAGHNPAGVDTLLDTLDELFGDKKIITIMAMMKDKDFNTCIPRIAERSRLLIGTTVGQPRSLSPQELAGEAEKFCPTQTAENMEDAIKRAREAATADDLVLICGSVYAAGDALLILEP